MRHVAVLPEGWTALKTYRLVVIAFFLAMPAIAQVPPTTGFFSQSTLPATSMLPTSTFAGDFNGDGIVDLAVGNECFTGDCQNSGIGIFLGNGGGTFRAGASYQTSVRNGTWITGGDFNGDGKLDLALASTNCQFVPCPAGVVSVFLGHGDGTFSNPANFGSAPAPFFIVAADINGDGKVDLITANNCVSNCGNAAPLAVSVLLGDGKGGFQKSIDTELDNKQYAFWIAVGDLNGDGIPDLATSDYCLSGCNPLDSTMSILLGNGNGTFTAGGDYTLPGGLTSIVMQDFNRDGFLDIAATNVNNAVVIYLGDGTGGLTGPTFFAVGKDPSSIVAGDVNNDGIVDLATGNFAELESLSASVSVLLGKGDGTFSGRSDSPTGNAPQGIIAADFNGDGLLDLANANFNDGTVSVLLQTQVKVVPSMLSFSSTVVGSASAQKTVTVTNIGSKAIGISGVTTAGTNAADFQIVNHCGASLGPRKSCTIAITFVPGLQGQRTGQLIISDDAPGGQQTLPLLGEGQALSVTPKAVGFGVVKVGTSSNPAMVTLTNHSSESVDVKSIAISGANRKDFSATNNCPQFLKLNVSCTISITFSPSFVGKESADLNVDQNGGGPFIKIPLSGAGN